MKMIKAHLKNRMIAAIAASALLNIGRMIYLDNDLGRLITRPAEIAAYTAASLVVFFLFFYVVDLALPALSGKKGSDDSFFSASGKAGTVRSGFLARCHRYLPLAEGLLVFIMNLLAFLAYFPGIFSYDIDYQTWQAAGSIPLNNHHPVLHTLIWKAFYDLEQLTGVRYLGITAYGILQILVVSITAAWLMKKVGEYGMPTTARLVFLILTLFMPHMAIFSMIPTKDVYFACALIVFTVKAFEIAWENANEHRVGTKKGDRTLKQPLELLIFGVLACLLRNNMLYVVILLLAVSLAVRYPKRLVLSLAGIIAVVLLMTMVIFPASGVERGPVGESMSIPMQQLARAYETGENVLTVDEREQIRMYLPEVTRYNPRFADPIKNSFDEVYYLEHKGEFWSIYFSIGKKMPGTYLDAFLATNVDYWYLFAETSDPFADREYIETGIYRVDEYPMERASLLPGLYQSLETWAHFENGFMKRFPILYTLAAPFAFVYVLAYVILRRGGKPFGPILVIYGGLLATYLLGPVSNFRYVYPLFLAMPLLVFPIFCIRGLKFSEEDL
ncbi:MAG: hypothetical protein IJ589_04465 [Lachnospiraceae bacterium]|nr:hypothetical protein [Lachnospiraceae bacterium]